MPEKVAGHEADFQSSCWHALVRMARPLCAYWGFVTLSEFDVLGEQSCRWLDLRIVRQGETESC